MKLEIESLDELKQLAVMLTANAPELIQQILTKLTETQMTLDELKTKVEAENTVIDSAMTLLNGLSAQIRDLSTDPAKLQALADEIDAKTAALSASVAANTPATPPAPPAPTPAP